MSQLLDGNIFPASPTGFFARFAYQGRVIPNGPPLSNQKDKLHMTKFLIAAPVVAMFLIAGVASAATAPAPAKSVSAAPAKHHRHHHHKAPTATPGTSSSSSSSSH